MNVLVILITDNCDLGEPIRMLSGSADDPFGNHDAVQIPREALTFRSQAEAEVYLGMVARKPRWCYTVAKVELPPAWAGPIASSHG